MPDQTVRQPVQLAVLDLLVNALQLNELLAIVSVSEHSADLFPCQSTITKCQQLVESDDMYTAEMLFT